jgi:hypothetical protein
MDGEGPALSHVIWYDMIEALVVDEGMDGSLKTLVFSVMSICGDDDDYDG